VASLGTSPLTPKPFGITTARLPIGRKSKTASRLRQLPFARALDMQNIARARTPCQRQTVVGGGARELMVSLLMGDDDELQGLIKTHMILPYLFGDFDPSHIQEYAGGLLLISFWRLSPLPHTRIRRRPFTHARETCQGWWGCPPHHLRRKLATLFCQPRRQCCPGSYLSYSYIYIRKFLTDCRSPGRRLPLRQDSFLHVCST
jgi:hypothetical protein